MFIASYRNTEAGVKALLAQRASIEKARADEAEMMLKRERMKRLEAEAEIGRQRKMLIEELIRAREAAERQRVIDEACRYRRGMGRIKRTACRVFGVTIEELNSGRRGQSLSFARQFVMYWAVRLTPLSTPQIGRRLGGRDHSTIVHGRTAYVQKRAAMGRNLREAR